MENKAWGTINNFDCTSAGLERDRKIHTDGESRELELVLVRVLVGESFEKSKTSPGLSLTPRASGAGPA